MSRHTITAYHRPVIVAVPPVLRDVVHGIETKRRVTLAR